MKGKFSVIVLFGHSIVCRWLFAVFFCRRFSLFGGTFFLCRRCSLLGCTSCISCSFLFTSSGSGFRPCLLSLGRRLTPGCTFRGGGFTLCWGIRIFRCGCRFFTFCSWLFRCFFPRGLGPSLTVFFP